VDQQDGVAGSTLELYRALLRSRRVLSLGSGSLAFVEGYGPDVVAFVNGSADGDRLLVVANLGPDPVMLPDGAEVIAASAPLDGKRVPTDTTVWARWP
jgi:alpha-glucosidase